jgi:osmotically inducible lipoprotein OsmB
MRKLILAGAALAALAAAPVSANADERTYTGVAIGAGTGAIIAGPPGAIVGGVLGAVIKGPRIHRHKHCWIGKSGRRHCRYT